MSWKTFATLWIGLALWIVYGVMREDVVIGIANGISLCLLSGILFFKVREMRAAPDAARTARTG